MLAGRKKMEAADVRSYMRAFVDQPGRIDVRTVARALVGLTQGSVCSCSFPKATIGYSRLQSCKTTVVVA